MIKTTRKERIVFYESLLLAFLIALVFLGVGIGWLPYSVFTHTLVAIFVYGFAKKD